MQSNPTDLTKLIIMAIILVGSSFLYFAAIHGAKKQIRDFLEESGARNVLVEHNWPDFDRDTYSFSVRYIAPNGKIKDATCKIHHFWFATDEEIFWANPASLDLLERQPIKASVNAQIRASMKQKFPNYDVVKLLVIPRSDERIILLKYTEDFQNVLRCRADGTVIWQAELPTPEDTYKEIRWEDGELIATSRYLRSYNLDKETGRIISPHL